MATENNVKTTTEAFGSIVKNTHVKKIAPKCFRWYKRLIISTLFRT